MDSDFVIVISSDSENEETCQSSANIEISSESDTGVIEIDSDAELPQISWTLKKKNSHRRRWARYQKSPDSGGNGRRRFQHCCRCSYGSVRKRNTKNHDYDGPVIRLDDDNEVFSLDKVKKEPQDDGYNLSLSGLENNHQVIDVNSADESDMTMEERDTIVLSSSPPGQGSVTFNAGKNTHLSVNLVEEEDEVSITDSDMHTPESENLHVESSCCSKENEQNSMEIENHSMTVEVCSTNTNSSLDLFESSRPGPYQTKEGTDLRLCNEPARHFLDIFPTHSGREDVKDKACNANSLNSLTNGLFKELTLSENNVKDLPLSLVKTNKKGSETCKIRQILNVKAFSGDKRNNDLENCDTHQLINGEVSLETKGPEECKSNVCSSSQEPDQHLAELHTSDSVGAQEHYQEYTETLQGHIEIHQENSETHQNQTDSYQKHTKTHQGHNHICSDNISTSVSIDFLPISSAATTSVSSSQFSSESSNKLLITSDFSNIESSKLAIETSGTANQSQACSFRSKGVKRQIRLSSYSNFHLGPGTDFSVVKQRRQLKAFIKDYINIHEVSTVRHEMPNSVQQLILACKSMDDEILDLSHALPIIDAESYPLSKDVVNNLIKSAFLSSEVKSKDMHYCYRLLSSVNVRFPGTIEVEWDTIDQCLNILVIRDESSAERQEAVCLLLKLLVTILKTDLYSHKVGDAQEVRKSLCHRILAYEVSSCNRRRLVYYFNHIFSSSTDVFEFSDHEDSVLWLLQDLLTLCVDVSSSCVDCANALSSDLLPTYTCMPHLQSKHLLLKSFTSHLLRYKLIQRVLETQFLDVQPLCGFPDSLAALRRCFFEAVPIVNPEPHPESPGIGNAPVIFNPITTQHTEELSMLLYSIMESYLRASKEKTYMALRRRVYHLDRNFRDSELRDLQQMALYAADLEDHLRQLTPELTSRTQYYLSLIKMLVDVSR